MLQRSNIVSSEEELQEFYTQLQARRSRTRSRRRARRRESGRAPRPAPTRAAGDSGVAELGDGASRAPIAEPARPAGARPCPLYGTGAICVPRPCERPNSSARSRPNDECCGCITPDCQGRQRVIPWSPTSRSSCPARSPAPIAIRRRRCALSSRARAATR